MKVKASAVKVQVQRSQVKGNVVVNSALAQILTEGKWTQTVGIPREPRRTRAVQDVELR